MPTTKPTFQEVILRLQTYWDKQGCALLFDETDSLLRRKLGKIDMVESLKAIE